MNTIFLSNDEVTVYLADLCERLVDLKDNMPMVWCPIGPSGGELTRVAMGVAGKLAAVDAAASVAWFLDRRRPQQFRQHSIGLPRAGDGRDVLEQVMDRCRAQAAQGRLEQNGSGQFEAALCQHVSVSG